MRQDPLEAIVWNHSSGGTSIPSVDDHKARSVFCPCDPMIAYAGNRTLRWAGKTQYILVLTISSSDACGLNWNSE